MVALRVPPLYNLKIVFLRIPLQCQWSRSFKATPAQLQWKSGLTRGVTSLKRGTI